MGQIQRGVCWLMIRLNESNEMLSSRPLEILKKELKKQERENLAAKGSTPPVQHFLKTMPSEPSRQSNTSEKLKELTHAFREGDYQTRRIALKALEEMNEIEIF
jgi:hypothetical protein